MLMVVRRLCGQSPIAPSGVVLQSMERTRTPIAGAVKEGFLSRRLGEAGGRSIVGPHRASH